MAGTKTMAWLFAAIATIAVLGLLALAISKATWPVQQAASSPLDKAQSAGAVSPLPTAAAHDSGKESQGHEEGHPSGYWDTFVTYIEERDKFFTAFGTLIIAAFTICLALATLFLYRSTKDLVEGADANAEKQLRAYVFVQGGFVAITPDGGGFVANIAFKNFGQTPALSFSTWLGGGVFDYNDLPFPKPKPLSERVNRSIVGPGADVNLLTDSALLGDIAAIRNKTKAIFVWGGLDYVDAFGHPRFILIRTQMSGPERDLGNGVRGWALAPHALGYEGN